MKIDKTQTNNEFSFRNRCRFCHAENIKIISKAWSRCLPTSVFVGIDNVKRPDRFRKVHLDTSVGHFVYACDLWRISMIDEHNAGKRHVFGRRTHNVYTGDSARHTELFHYGEHSVSVKIRNLHNCQNCSRVRYQNTYKIVRLHGKCTFIAEIIIGHVWTVFEGSSLVVTLALGVSGTDAVRVLETPVSSAEEKLWKPLEFWAQLKKPPTLFFTDENGDFKL